MQLGIVFTSFSQSEFAKWYIVKSFKLGIVFRIKGWIVCNENWKCKGSSLFI